MQGVSATIRIYTKSKIWEPKPGELKIGEPNGAVTSGSPIYLAKIQPPDKISSIKYREAVWK